MLLRVKHVNVFLLFVLIYLVFVGLSPFSTGNTVESLSTTGKGNLFKQLSFIMLFVISVLANYKSIIANLVSCRKEYLLLTVGLLLLCLNSLFYSNVAMIGFRRVALTFIILFTSFILITRLGLKECIGVVSYSLYSLLFISVVLCVVYPKARHGIDVVDPSLLGTWRGVFGHKNVAGYVAGIVFMLAVFNVNEGNGKLNTVFIALSLLLLVKTQSKTALILLLPSIGFALVLGGRFSVIAKRIFLIFFVFSICMIFLGMSESFTRILSDPTSFTGRAGIWSVIVEVIKQNLFWGVGFGSLYHVGEQSLLLNYTQEWIGVVAHGHNGFLDVLVSIGIFGFSLFLYLFIIVPYKIIGFTSAFSSKLRFALLAILSYTVLNNLLESSFLNTIKPGWLVISIIFCLVLLATRKKEQL